MSKIDPPAFFSSLARRLRPRAKNVTLQAEPFLRIESLEPRLLLSADPLSAALGFDAAALLLDPPEYPAIHEAPGDGLSATLLGVSGAEPGDDWRQDADLAGLIEVFPGEAREALDLAGFAALRPMLESTDGQPGEFTPHDDFDAADPELQFEALPVAAADTISLRDASALNSAAELGSHSRLELIVVDAAVDDYQTLVDSITDGDDGTWYRVLVLDGDADGVAQISAALAGMEGVGAIHLLAHGSEGALQLGNSWLDSDTLSIYAAALADWGLALDADADLLIYGCDLAASGAGEALLQEFAQLTGADIAASDDLTGSAELGGDWDLEYHVGVIETQLALDLAAQQWRGTLAIFTVDTQADTEDANPGDGNAADILGNTSLRAAIMEANALAGDDVIDLPAGTYTLTDVFQGDLNVTSTIRIDGQGAATTIIDGGLLGGIDRVFSVASADGDLSLSQLTVRDGAATGGGMNGWGGAILVRMSASLSLDNVVITGSNAAYGAGIYNQGTIALVDAVISNNGTGTAQGGGLYNEGIATLERVTVSGNSADQGGGIFNAPFPGVVLKLTNVTLSGNSATIAEGGGLYNARTATLQNVTIADNDADTDGGGIFNTGGTVNISNTIVADNTAGRAGKDVFGSFVSDGFNVIEDINGATAGDFDTDLTGADPDLDPLANNGGFSETHALQVVSIAIDAGSNASPPLVDQRIGVRADGLTDIGAFEFGASPVNLAPSNVGSFPAVEPELLESGTVIIDFSAINLRDSDAGASNLRIVVTTSAGGLLSASDKHSVTVSGSGTTVLTLNGELDDLNTYLDDNDEISFTGAAGVTGDNADAIGVIVNDDAGSGDIDLGTLNVDIVPRVITVTVTGDENNGDTSSILALLASPGGSGISLREALEATNNTLLGTTPDEIILPAGTYVIRDGDIDIEDDVLITGSGARSTVLDARFNSGIFRIRDGISTMTGLTVTGGSGGADGGAIRVDIDTTLNLFNVTVSDSVANKGAGIHVDGTLNLDSVTLSGNNASEDGGAIYFDGTAGGTLVNVTISGNSADDEGGGIWTEVPITVTNSTIAFNTAPLGGGIFDRDGAEVTLGNSVLFNPGADNSNRALDSAGANIDSDGTAGLGDTLDGANPLLAPLANNGGPTDTHLPAALSPAIDAVGVMGAPPLDQRGVPRDGSPDIGAVEGQGNNAPTGAVSIDNTDPAEDDVLTASNTLSDDDGITPGAISYSWKADGATVGAGDTYTVTQNDVGKVITVEASYTDDGGTLETVSSEPTAAVLNTNDAPTGTVMIDNTSPAEGDKLTLSDSVADEDGIVPPVTYQWFQGTSAITGETGLTYVTQAADVGETISVVASYSDAFGQAESVSSTPTDPVANVNFPPTGEVSIDNKTPAEDDVLTASNTLMDADGITSGAITYSWKADGASVGAGDTYTVTQNDVGKAITVEASYTDDDGTLETVSSGPTAAVLNINDPPTGGVTIDNTTPAEDDVLTASNTLMDEDGITPGAISYSWQADGSVVGSGATYTATQADVGKAITVEATYVDDFGIAESVASDATSNVTNINDDPTGTVSINNAAPAEDDVLTASNTLVDADGITPGAITYSWKADGTTVGSGNTYTVTQNDVGKAITVEASYTDDGGTQETVSSGPTAAVLNTNDAPTGAVTIDNSNPSEDDVLTASNALMDADGITPGAITHSWKADGATVAAGDTYTVTQNDVGKAITVEASYTDGGGTLETVSSGPTAAVLNTNDAPMGAVTIDNTTPAEGDTLALSDSVADEDGIVPPVTYQWFQGASAITGETGLTYVTQAADVGETISVVASYSDAFGQAESVSSAPTDPVANVNFPPTGAVSIDNTAPAEDDVLTASDTLADADGITPGAITYSWQADGTTVGAGATYTVTQNDVGKVITVEASYTDDDGTLEAVSSAPTAAVLNINDLPTGAVSIDNSNPSEDDVLTASNTLMDADGITPGAITYSWKADGATVGAGDTYTVTQNNVGKAITVEASYTDDGGTPEAITSVPTAAVLNINDAPTGAVTINNSNPSEDDVLTVSNTLADEDGITPGAITYSWKADGATVGAGATYTVTQNDVGKAITVEASYTDDGGTTEAITSAPTAAVLNINDDPTGTVSIDNGNPSEDDVLTASNTLMDADGITPGAITYTWKADGATVGAGDTYTVTQNNVGKAITVEASYTDDGGTPEAITSVPTAAVLNINDAPTGAVSIDNTAPAEDDVLTASNTLMDADGITPGAITYSWKADGATVGAGATYTVTQNNVGKAITVEASYTDDGGTPEAITSAPTAAVLNINDAPTGAVTIDNTTPAEDDVLTASNTLADEDGITPGAITYSWKADGATVGAGATYTVTQNDVGKAITVEASYTDDDGTLEAVSSAPTAAVLNTNDDPTGTVSIDNSSPSEDDVLSASNTLTDADGITPGAITYSWKADGAAVGAGNTYTVTQNDVGKAITVEASYTDDGGTPEAITSAPTAAVLNINDAPTGAVTIDNTTPAEDDVLTASNTLADGDGIPAGTIAYTWKADGSVVGSGATYTATQSDVGKAITVEATYVDGFGTAESVASDATASVNNVNDDPTGTVNIDNTAPAEDDVLTASNTLADADGITPGAITYSWKADGVAVGAGDTYTVTQNDVGKAITVEASYTDDGGTQETVGSAPTAAVLNINDPPTGGVTIDNTTPAEGDTLTLSDSVADEDGIVAPVTYQWFRGASAITGETGQTYVTQAADIGATIGVVASYSDVFGQAESVSSAPTNPVSSIGNASPTGAVSIDNTAPAEDDVLTASNTLMDADGIPAGAIAYAWKADGATVGAGDTYTVTQNDVGKAITVEASYTDDGGTVETVSSAPTTAVLNINDDPAGTVSIDNGNPSEDDVLSASNTLMDADGIAPGAITYSWKADGATVGAGDTYTVTQNDVGKAITVEASYTDDGGTQETVGSAPTAAVLNINDPSTGAVSIDNSNPSEDDVLTASNTLMDADGIAPGAITYSWKADGATVGAGDTYTVTQNDVGKAITVEASYTDDGGTLETVSSGPTAAVLNINDAPTGAVTIDNSNPSEDDVLTASNTLADEDGITPGAITYSWKADGATVGAGDTYTVTQNDVGKAITVEASYSDDDGTVETVSSGPTAAVLNINDAPTGAVTIDNSNPSEDDVLTASNTLADEDGITPGAITYSWKADGATVGAGDTYTVTQNDVGKAITVEASYTDDGGTPEAMTSAPTAAVLNINDAPTGAVSIDNTTPAEDDVLTASNTLADEDGITPGAISYSWQADGAAVGSGNTYTVTQNDVGKAITVEASYTDDGGTQETVGSAPTAAVLNINDAPTGAVTIDNTAPTEGDTLTLSDSVADEDGIVAPVTYQWFRGASAITGETGQTYVTQAADVGETIGVVASYSDAFGQTESVSSTPTNPVSSIDNASPTGAVTIDNTAPAEDDVLTASNTLMDADGIPAGAIAYTWKADGSVVGSGATYTATQGDVGKAITVEASYTDDGGTVETVSSGPTAAVLNINDGPTGAVTIDNTTPAEDDVLTAFNTLMDADGITPGAITYSWKADGATVGAGDTYTVTQNDFGKAITVEASYTDDGGTLEAITSVPTAAVLNINDAPTGAVTIDNAAPAEDDVLTASNTLMDADGIPAGAIAYTWKADGSVVGSGDTYTATQGDSGKAITVEASYTDAGGTVETVSSEPTAAVLNINDAPTGAVTIDNTTPAEGDTLTLSDSVADEDGIVAPATYQWFRGASAITGETGPTYVTQAADVGETISVVASYSDAFGQAESVSSAPTNPVSNINDAPTGAVTIDNTTPAEDDILTASNTLMDADGITTGAITYSWKADGATVGAGDTYTVNQNDVGRAITVEASYTDDGGSPEAITSAPTAAVLNINDAPTGAVTIDNTTPAEGDTLTLSDSVADEDGIVAPVTYQWFQGASAITGETGPTYVTQAADVGEAISVVASYSDAFGQAESVSSAPTNPVSSIGNASPTGAVTIDNTAPAEDDVLTASNTLMDADGIPAGAIAYTWKADGSVVGSGATYTATQGDVGKAITVEASYTDDRGTPEAITSAPTATVLNINDVPTGTVSIDNSNPLEDDVLTASNTLMDADGIPAGAITYAWKADGATVGTGDTYTVTQNDVGRAITVEASYTDDGGTPEAITSAPTAAVLNINDAPTGAVTIDNSNPSEDDVLTASNTLADADGITPGAISYSWKADGAIAGAGDTYTVPQNDVGKVITVEASYTDDGGTPEAITSAPTAAVLNINDAPFGLPVITGVLEPGTTLSVDTSEIDDGDGMGTLSYQWQRAGIDIPGEVGGSYTLVDADLSREVSVVVSYTDGTGTSESLSSDGVVVFDNSDETAASRSEVAVLSVNLFVILERDSESENVSGGTAELAVDADTVTLSEVGDDTGGEDEAAAGDEAAESESSNDVLAAAVFAGGTVELANVVSGPAILYEGDLSGLLSDFGGGSVQAAFEVDPAIKRDAPMREVIFNILTEGTDTTFDSAIDPLVLVASQGFSDGLDQMRESVRQDLALTQTMLGGTVTLTAGFSIGYVVWLARSGVLISAAMSALPAWRFMDPLPILAQSKKQAEDDDDESLESMVGDTGVEAAPMNDNR